MSSRSNPVSPAEVELRRLTEADADRFWALRQRALREHPEAFGRSDDEERATPIAEVPTRVPSPPDGFVLGAWREDELVGTVGLRRMAPEKQRHKALLWGVYVAPGVRGLGVARRLLAAAVADACELPGLEQIQLMVGSRSPAARRLYASLGFAPFGLERQATKLDPGDYVDQEHSVLFLDRCPSPRKRAGRRDRGAASGAPARRSGTIPLRASR